MTAPRVRTDSYWMSSTPATAYPALDTDTRADVAVVGAGIAGLSAAWELAASGRSVVVLEADRVAAGVTGFTTAKVTAQHGLVYARLTRSLGAEAARHYAASQQEAVRRVAELTERLGIDCELEHRPAVCFAESPERVAEIAEEAEAAMNAGLTAGLSGGSGLPFPVAGTAIVPDQLQFHPRRYALALTEDLRRRGGRVYERTRVTELHEGAPCRLRTETGRTVTADEVVIATHYPVFDRAMLFSRLEPRRELVVAAPIPADRDPGGMYITPEHNTRSVRTAPYGDGRRLLIVTGETFRPGTVDVAEHFGELSRWTAERFGVERIDYRWAAQDNHTTDGVPYIGPFHAGAEHTYVATGFGAWGMSSGVLSGLLITALIEGRPPEWAGLYDPRRLHPLAEAGAFVRSNAEVARHLVGDRLPFTHVDSVADIGPGQGALTRVDGERCAVYRDPSGALHAVSAVCTHLGCLVRFDDAEPSWDCPCHGSRFGVDGSVLQGPATAPLERRELGGADEGAGGAGTVRSG